MSMDHPRSPRTQMLIDIRVARVRWLCERTTPRSVRLPSHPGGYIKAECGFCQLTMWSMDRSAANPICGACRLPGRYHIDICGICFDHCRPLTFLSCSDKHPFCASCLGKYIEVNVSDFGRADHICPHPACNRSIPEKALAKLSLTGHLSKPHLAQHKSLRSADQCARLRTLLQPDGNSMFEWLQVNAQVCPHYYALVQRSSGCNHMTCACGQEFCYKCGAAYPLPSKHENHWQNEPTRLNIELLGPDGLPIFAPPAAVEPPPADDPFALPILQCAPCDGVVASDVEGEATAVAVRAGMTSSAEAGLAASASQLPRTKAEARERLLFLFTLRCPNALCRHPICMDAAFADCFALTCSRCESHFCAWCLRLARAQEDLHSHVLDCTAAPDNMRGSALYLHDHNGGPHEAPHPKAKFVAHWRQILRGQAEAMLSEMAEAAAACDTAAAAASDGAWLLRQGGSVEGGGVSEGTLRDDGDAVRHGDDAGTCAVPYDAARDETALRELIELHLCVTG
jgi:hypothetical protein